MKIFFISFQDAGQVKAQDWSGKNDISLILVHDEETNVAVEQHKREFTGAVVVNNTGDIVGKSSKTEMMVIKWLLTLSMM